MTRHLLHLWKGLAVLLFLSFMLRTTSNAQVPDLPDNYYEYTITTGGNIDPGYLFMFARPQTPVKYPGYLLILDQYGTPVYYKYLPYQSGAFALQRNGLVSFLRMDDAVDQFYLMDHNYEIVDSVSIQGYELDSHDFMALENGHYLLLGQEVRTIDMSAIVAGGQPNASVKGTVIQEVDADKNVVFEWNSFDHYQITDSYSDLTKSSIDFVHGNSLEVDADGNILLIARSMNEVTKIDRQTGDIIWRLGGKNDQFTWADPSHKFSFPHDFKRMANGHYTIFDNGKERDPAYSRAVEYVIDQENKTIEMVWEYDADKNVYSPSGGSVLRLKSGNTLVCYGGQVSDPCAREVHPDGTLAFSLSFVNPDIRAGSASKFAWKTTLFEPLVDTIKFGDWDGYTEQVYLLGLKNNSDEPISITSVYLHTDSFYVDENLPVEIPAGETKNVKVVFYPTGAAEGSTFSDLLTLNYDRDETERIAVQVFLQGKYPDTTPPGVSFTPAEASIPNDTLFRVIFSEPVQKMDGTELTDDDLAGVIILKKGGESGSPVAYTATINAEKTVITVEPDSHLENGADYYLAVLPQVEDLAGNTVLPGSKTFQAYSPAGFESPGKVSARLYPNPAGDILHLQFPNPPGKGNISLYNSLGMQVKDFQLRGKGSEEDLDLSDLPAGVYIVRITGKNGIWVEKIMKE